MDDVQLVEDSAGNVKIACPNAGKEFAAEEISAQVLRKLTDDAAKFLNDKVCIMQGLVCLEHTLDVEHMEHTLDVEHIQVSALLTTECRR